METVVIPLLTTNNTFLIKSNAGIATCLDYLVTIFKWLYAHGAVQFIK